MDYQFLTVAEQRTYAEQRAHAIEAEHYQNALAREETLTLPDDHPAKAAQVAQYDANLAVLDASHSAVLSERDRVDDVVADEPDAEPAVPIEPTPYTPPAEPESDEPA